LRLNPNNGGIAAVDGTLAYTSTDRNANANPNIVASAYTNNFPGPPSTTLYNIDSNLDVLVTQNPPNAGVLNTVGALGVDVGAVAGFDIMGANTAYASLQVGGGPSGLYMINLTSGAATLVGPIGIAEPVRGLAGMLSNAPATLTPAPPTVPTGGATGTPTAASTAAVVTPVATLTPGGGCPGGTANFFTATASGGQEVPPNNSPATGTGTFCLDPVTNQITFNFTYSGLTSTEVGAHLHRGAPGTTGPVIVPLPTGTVKSGTAPFPAADIENLRAGNVYINVHSEQFPGGEIRGQLIGQGVSLTVVPSTPAPTATSAVPTQSAEQTATAVAPLPTSVVGPPPGMPSTGDSSGTFFFLLLAATGIALISVGLLSRRGTKI
jgi:hypothetical protein